MPENTAATIKKEKTLKEKVGILIAERMETDQKLPTEKEMMAQFNVSRSSLREVLSIYESNGIIHTVQGSGRYITPPNFSAPLVDTWSILIEAKPALLLNLLDIRCMLEINSLSTAMRYIDIKQLQLLQAEVNAMKEKSAAGKTFASNDREFHRILFSSTKNILLEQLLTAFWDLYSLARVETYHEELPTLAQQHGDILAAFTQEDLEMATSLLKQQFDDARQQIKIALLDNE
ncbi:FadR/GntR family transcriptional regulator [Luxibacter massiliensis]|uniref:FadR/GntR family transcriptional regulator n=1 Tax=Luxibacter massiliensis TaxID=2219695 RepID=UPI000F04757A|nr:FCD domain-containing protein [Luxibacter massiliensis]